MAFTINGTAVAFSSATFVKMVESAGGRMFTWRNSSMGNIRKLVEANAAGSQVKGALLNVSDAKSDKYKAAVRYLLYHYPNVVTVNPTNPDLAPPRNNFIAQLSTQKAGDYADLVYGIESGRKMLPYVPTAGSRPRFCDDFNNAAQLGTGYAFDRQWNGQGFLDATDASIHQKMKNKSATQTDLPGTAMNTYTSGLIGSKYAPGSAMNADAGRLKPNQHKGLAEMTQLHGAKIASKHVEAHARWLLGIRRACKGGIAMVASDAGYRQAQAQVHFILDGMGDLGAVAFKMALPGKGDYVPITSSELGFCFRYWDHPNYPLKLVVRMYVNGDRVLPPWEGDWTKQDASGQNVVSNQEAWLRYGLYKNITSPNGLTFPEWRAEDN